MLCRWWSVKSSGKQAFIAFKSAILHACTRERMTNDSIVGTISIQLVPACRKDASWMGGLRCLPFIYVDEGNIVSRAPLGTRILCCCYCCCSHNNSASMIDHVGIRPRHDRHQFNGNCIVFFWGNLHPRGNIREKWVCMMHYVDASWIWGGSAAFLGWFMRQLACFWSCAMDCRIQHPGCQNDTEGCFVLVFFHPLPPRCSSVIFDLWFQSPPPAFHIPPPHFLPSFISPL